MANPEIQKKSPVENKITVIASTRDKLEVLKSNTIPEADTRLANVDPLPSDPKKGIYRGACVVQEKSLENSFAFKLNNPVMIRSSTNDYWVLDRTQKGLSEVLFDFTKWPVIEWQPEKKNK